VAQGVLPGALRDQARKHAVRLVFGYPESDFDLEDQPPLLLTRSVLPALKALELYGEGEYLDDFVARIDVPSLHFLQIVPINRPSFVIDFFHLPQFIGRVDNIRSPDYARIELWS